MELESFLIRAVNVNFVLRENIKTSSSHLCQVAPHAQKVHSSLFQERNRNRLVFPVQQTHSLLQQDLLAVNRAQAGKLPVSATQDAINANLDNSLTVILESPQDLRNQFVEIVSLGHHSSKTVLSVTLKDHQLTLIVRQGQKLDSPALVHHASADNLTMEVQHDVNSVQGVVFPVNVHPNAHHVQRTHFKIEMISAGQMNATHVLPVEAPTGLVITSAGKMVVSVLKIGGSTIMETVAHAYKGKDIIPQVILANLVQRAYSLMEELIKNAVHVMNFHQFLGIDPFVCVQEYAKVGLSYGTVHAGVATLIPLLPSGEIAEDANRVRRMSMHYQQVNLDA